MATIKDKVEEKLKEAQKSKAFKDIGRVSNLKKELAAFRLINKDNLDELEQDKVVAFNMVKKEAVWIPIDLYKEKEKGTSPGAAFLKVKIREYLPAKPQDGEGYRKAYVTALTTLQNDLEPLLTVEEIKTLVDSYFKLDVYDYSKKFIGNVPDAITREQFIQNYKEKTYRFFSPSSAIKEQFGAKFKNLVYINSDAAKEIWAKAIGYNSVSEQEAQQKKDVLVERREKFIAANLFNLGEYKQMNHSQLLDKIKVSNISSFFIKEYKANPELFRDWAIKSIERNIEKGKKDFDAKIEAITPKDADWSWAFEEKVSDSGEVTVSKPKHKPINTKTPLTYIKRTGGYKVNDVTGNGVINTVGFTAVNYGNYVDDKWSKQHTKHFIEAMVDFGEILNIDIKKLTQLGSLKIAFGAKGRPGHLATYFPQTKDINLTKGNGDGSLAHEYGHYIDNVLLEGANKSTTSYFMTESQKHYDEQLNSLFKDLMKFLVYGNSTATPLVPFTFYAIKSDRVPSVYISGENSYLSGKVKLKDTLEETIALYAPLCELYDKNYIHEIQVDIFGYILNHFGVDKMEIPLKLKTSYFYHKSAYSNFIYNYYSDQKKKYVIGVDPRTNYWIKRVELFARAFETVILKKLVDKNRMSNYLVADISLEDIISEHNTAPYPTGKELEVIEGYIDKIIDRIKYLYAIGDFVPPSDVRQDEYTDLTPTGKEDAGMVVTESKDEKKIEFTEDGKEVKQVEVSKEDKVAFIEKRVRALTIVSNRKKGTSYEVLKGVGKQINRTYGGSDDGIGDFYTDNKTMASWFAGMIDFNELTGGYKKTNEQGRIYSYKIVLSNPLILDESVDGYDLEDGIDTFQIYMKMIENSGGVKKFRDSLIKKGYDGIILKGNITNYYEKGTYNIYIVFPSFIDNRIKALEISLRALGKQKFAKGGLIKDANGYLKYTINDDEITLDLIESKEKRKGTATKLINKLKEISRKKKKPIGLYAEPQDNSISDKDLIDFYYKNGFELDPNDVDGKLLIWEY